MLQSPIRSAMTPDPDAITEPTTEATPHLLRRVGLFDALIFYKAAIEIVREPPGPKAMALKRGRLSFQCSAWRRRLPQLASRDYDWPPCPGEGRDAQQN